MVGKVIRSHFEGGAKKLTVPGFGTFMRKDGGEVIFVDLLRTDDGVLSELVEDYGNYSEVEAMALIDRFIFETRTTIERAGHSKIDGFGTLTLDHKGAYRFDYTPRAVPRRENAVQEKLFEHKQKDSIPAPVKAKEQVRTTPVHTTQKTQRTPKPSPRNAIPGKSRKKQLKPDAILLIAIAVAVVAVIVLVFGISSGNIPFLNR